MKIQNLSGYPSTLGCKSSDGKMKEKVLKKCKKIERILQKCDFKCKVDGGWSEFTDWETCSVECDGGTQTRNRTCSDPAPDHGGADCIGSAEKSQDCNTQPCQRKPRSRQNITNMIRI